MANLDPLKISTFARISRTEESYAVRKLMQNGENLNAALDAHYHLADSSIASRYTPDPEDNLIDRDVREETSSRELHDAATRELLHFKMMSNASTNMADINVQEETASRELHEATNRKILHFTRMLNSSTNLADIEAARRELDEATHREVLHYMRMSNSSTNLADTEVQEETSPRNVMMLLLEN